MGLDFLFGGNKSVDSLTQVYNREVVVEYINFLVSGNVPFSLALIDIDNFKYINDTYGHIAGDKVLAEIAGRIAEVVDDRGTVARFGGDEFLIVFPDITAYEEIWQICRNLMAIMNGCEIKELAGQFVSITVGVSRFPENEKTYEGLLEMADKALYRGKTKGRNCFIIYLPEKHADIVLKKDTEKSLSSMYLHSMVFRLLTKTPDKKEGIKNLFNFLSSYFSLDHICIQKNREILVEKVHNLSPVQSFLPLKLNLIHRNLSTPSEFFYINQLDALSSSNQMELCSQYAEQQINSAFAAEILEDDDDNLLMLRVESISRREWQYGEMDIFITAAKIIEMMLLQGEIDF